MALVIKAELLRELPTTVKSSLAKMSEEDQTMFQKEYEEKRKSTTSMVLLAIFFPIQLFLLGKTGLGIAFLLTAGGMGIWWIAELFMTSGRVRTYNENIATNILMNMKILLQ